MSWRDWGGTILLCAIGFAGAVLFLVDLWLFIWLWS